MSPSNQMFVAPRSTLMVRAFVFSLCVALGSTSAWAHPGDHPHDELVGSWLAHAQLLPIVGAFFCACLLVAIGRRRRS